MLDIKVLLAKHVPSFIKTYIAGFLAIVFYAVDVQHIDVFTTVFLIGASKASLITSLRTVYKVITEDVPAARE